MQFGFGVRNESQVDARFGYASSILTVRYDYVVWYTGLDYTKGWGGRSVVEENVLVKRGAGTTIHRHGQSMCSTDWGLVVENLG